MDLSKKFSYLPVLLCFYLAFLFTACEGFFTNNNVDEKIRAAIDYANAPYSTYVVSADSNAGTIIPSGQVQYKPTDIQIITFTLKPTHEFIRWNFSYKETSKSDGSITLTAADPNWWKDYITIKKDEHGEPDSKGEIEYTLEIQFTKATENLLIEPVCSLKPQIKSFSPSYDLKGVSREAQVSIEFNSAIDLNSIFFSQEEITAISGITNVLKNDQNQIYGYEKDSQRFFKNIEILLGNTEINVNDCFGDFSYRADINTLFITPKKGVEIVGEVAEVKIHLMSGIINSDGAALTETTKVYCVNKSTNQKADIDIKYNTNSPATHINPFAFIDQEIAFPADETVQFLYWKITANSPEFVDKITVYNDSDKTPSMKFCANTVILPSEGVTITAVYKKRPSIVTNGFEPMDQNDGVDKDSDIKIVFDQAVDLTSFIAGYKIDCNGNNVKENFSTPVLDSEDSANKTIKITASSDSTIDVDRGTKKKITVTIPAGLYYSYTDESDGTVYQITAGEDITRSYKINSNTKDRLYVNFSIPSNDMGSYVDPERAFFNRGEKFSIVFSEPEYGQPSFQKYQFFGWKIPASAASKIECVQSPSNSMLYEFTVKSGCDASSPVTITADVRERISIVSFTPADSTNGVPKDSDIEITFNKPLSLTNCKDLISISCNGQDVPDSFPKSSWKMTGNTLTIPADKSNRLTLNSTPKGRVQVTIDSNLTYTDTDGKIITFKESDRSKSYCINNSTIDYATLTFSENSNEGSITYESKDKYSIGEELSLTFTPDDDYEFLYWQISNANVGSFTQQKEISTKLKIDSEGSATISAKCAPKLKVSSFAPASGAAQPKDSDIVIEFNKKLSNKNNFATSISISMDGVFLTNNFKAATLADSTVTFEANQTNRIQLSGEKTVKVTLQNDLFYEYTDSVITTPKRIYMKDSEIKTYKINEDTIGKASVQVTNFNSSAGTIKNASTGQDFTTAVVDYSKDQTFTIDYNLNPGYQFVSWSITGVTDNITFSDVNKTSITISINDSIDGTVIIKPISYVRPTIKKDNLIPNNTNPPTVVPKNTAIVIPFEQAIDDSTKDEIIVSYSGISGFEKSTYFTTTISSDNKTVTLEPKKMLPVNNDYETVTITIPHDQIYYTVSDGVSNGTKIYTADEDFTWSYRVNNNTTTNTKVRISTEDALSRSTNIKINDVIQSSNTQKTVNVEESLNLEYPVSDGYKFAGWKIVSQNSSYTVTYSDTVNSSGYVKSGTIYVKNGSVDYFTLTIDSENSKKAVLTSIKSIDSNSNAYAFTVFAKDDLIPKVSTVTPSYSESGVACDTNITITFNKAINKNTVTFGNNGTIQILDNDNDHYENYFNTPTWSSNTLTIKPKYTIYDLLPNSTDTKNLMVKINSNSIKDSDGTPLGNDASWTYKINYNKETVSPNVIEIKLWKHEYSTTGVEQSDYKELSSLAFTSNSFDYTLNHINNKIYIDSTITDSGSGFKMVSIKETLVQTIDGTNTQLDVTPAVPQKFYSSQLEKQEYVLNSLYDGIIKLDFIFEDYAGNKTTKTFYVIKDTSLDSSKTIKPKFGFSTTSNGYEWSVVNETVKGSDGVAISPTVTNFTYYKKICDESKTNIQKLTPNSSGKLTLTLDFSSCKDTFAKNNETAVNYEVKWGEASNSIITSATKVNNTKFQITYTAAKDCYIQITACDNVGNKKTLTRVIPRQVSILDMIDYGTTIKKIKPSDKSTLEYIGKQYDAQEVNFLCYFTYKTSLTASNSDIYNNFSGTDVLRWGYCGRTQATGGIDLIDESNSLNLNFYLSNSTYKLTDAILTPNGLYSIYIIPYIAYPEGVYYGAASTVPYLYYHNISQSSSSTTPAFGSYSYTVSAQNDSQYSGVRNVKVTTSFTKTSGYTYGVAYKRPTWQDYDATLSTFDIIIPSGYTYQIFLYAKNNTYGTVYYEPESTRKTVDLTYDNVPPYVFGNSSSESFLWTGTNQIYFTSDCRPMDDPGFGVGFKDTADGYKTFDYYILPKQDSTTTAHDVITKTDLTGKTKRTAKFLNANKNNIQLDFNVFADGYYLLVLDLIDKNNNEALYTYTISNNTYPQITKVSYSTSTNKVVFDVYENPDNDTYYFNAGMGFYLASNGDWRLSSQESQLNSMDLSYKGDNTFYKVTRRSQKEVMTYTYYNFVSTEYWAKKLEDGTFPTCASKSMIPGYSNTYQVFFDAPCFAHTMACPKELVSAYAEKANEILTKCTDISYEQALASVWATKGQEFGCQLLNGDKFQNMSATYTCPVSKIPSDYAYMVIAHFADGSVVMSDIKIKE